MKSIVILAALLAALPASSQVLPAETATRATVEWERRITMLTLYAMLFPAQYFPQANATFSLQRDNAISVFVTVHRRYPRVYPAYTQPEEP